MDDWQSSADLTASCMDLAGQCGGVRTAGLYFFQEDSQRSSLMEYLWFYCLRSFKDIASHGAIFTTLFLSVVFYRFFYPFAYQAQQAEALPIIIVDAEQSHLSARIISQVRQSPDVE